MQVVTVDKKIIERLRKSGISSEMKSIELCDWLVIQEMNGNILGAAGIGSLLNTTTLQIGKNFRSKGIGPKIFVEFVNEAKVEITFDPPWTPEMMTEEARQKLGFTKLPENQVQTSWE